MRAQLGGERLDRRRAECLRTIGARCSTTWLMPIARSSCDGTRRREMTAAAPRARESSVGTKLL